MIKRLILPIAFFFISITFAFSQISGRVISSSDSTAVVGAMVTINELGTTSITNASGVYRFMDVLQGAYNISIKADGFKKSTFVSQQGENLGDIIIQKTTADVSAANDISTITEFELLDDQGGGLVSSLLSASRDPFNNATNFNLRAARFRVRGYEQELSQVFVNGIPFNTLNRGNAYWGMWGGLNDMFRARDETEGLQPTSFTLGSIGGATNLDIRASRHRKQLRASYSLANASYTNRVMLTYGSGVNEKGWVFSGSLSKRWGNEGYVKATFYDSYSGFFGVEKQFSNTESLGLSVFSVNTVRGRGSASTQEAYDLANDNFYNPNWGWLNGEKRNPRQYRNNLHTAILRYDNKTDDGTQILASAAFQTGKDGQSGIDWYDAADPRPDYYRKLPSFSDSPEVRALAEDYLSSNPDLLQLDLEKMYRVNNERIETIQSVDGITGNDITGKLASYKIQESRYDPTKLIFSTTVSKPWTDQLTTNSGLNYTYESINNFKVVDDLLGADFAVDWDNFADDSGDQSLLIDPAKQNNLLTPNNLLQEGDMFGYHYVVNHSKASAWTNVEYTLNKLDFFIAGGIDMTSFYRDGKYQNGRFPDDSFGTGEVKNYTTGTAKAGVTYKINGRNYAYATGAYLTRAPVSRNSYITPRTRATLIEGLEIEKITAGEIGYITRFPGFKSRFSLYYTDMKDQFETRNVYFDELNQFGNMILKNVDTRHIGMEFGAEIKLTSTMSADVAVAIGDHRYTSNPNVQVARDDLSDIIELGETYFVNRYVSGGPQTAGTLQLNYRSPKFWSLSINGNFFDNSYISMSPIRRVESRVGQVIEPQLSNLNAIDATSAGSEYVNSVVLGNPATDVLIEDIYGQEKYPRAITFDAFARKSWKKDDLYIALTASVNNIMNNRFRSGGFEQLRLRYRGSFDNDGQFQLENLFPPKYYYAYGTTYFISLSVSI